MWQNVYFKAKNPRKKTIGKSYGSNIEEREEYVYIYTNFIFTMLQSTI
jgi:hypothetical protein